MREDTSVKLTSEPYRERPSILTSRARMYICAEYQNALGHDKIALHENCRIKV